MSENGNAPDWLSNKQYDLDLGNDHWLEFVTDADRAEGWFNHVFRLLPPQLLRLAGALLYPHQS